MLAITLFYLTFYFFFISSMSQIIHIILNRKNYIEDYGAEFIAKSIKDI